MRDGSGLGWNASTSSRRTLLKTAAATAAATGLSSWAGRAGADGRRDDDDDDDDRDSRRQKEERRRNRRSGRQPNILLILVDEMRYPPVYEAAGLQQFRASFLQTQDALRSTGVEFHRHYAASTACAPSRASIFTGHYPSLHGVTQTTGAAKSAHDPDVYWLDPAGVPTMADYFRAGGYRCYYRGKWHVSEADLMIPGTHNAINSYTDTGARDPGREALYLEADRLAGYGFEGWIGPEPHGSAPLNSGSSPAGGRAGRDQGFAAQSVELLQRLHRSRDNAPWLMVSSFVNPHDIALWGYISRATHLFDLSVEDVVPAFAELFDAGQFAQTLADDLGTKPSCQTSYRQTYHDWMQPVPPIDYFRFYYQLHKDVDAEMAKVYEALRATRFFEDTIVVFTSDHGDLLGSHGYMHQKWHQVYDEALRVPFIISNPRRLPEGRSVHSVTSHIDLLPTLLGLARLEPGALVDDVAVGHSDPVALVGRNLTELATGEREALTDPVYFMTDDEPSRGLNQENIFGVGYDSVAAPNHIECVIAELDGEVWKFARYFDNVQFWTDPEPALGPTRDVVTTVEDGPIDMPGEHAVAATKRVKVAPVDDEYELYNLTVDPMELTNLAADPAAGSRRSQLEALLAEQREAKRLLPVSGPVPGAA
jgi:choline-sulfatase